MSDTVPFFVAIENLAHHDDDRLEHMLVVGVVAGGEPIRVEIESDFYKSPRVKEVIAYGSIRLPARLRDELIVKCFDMIVSAHRENETVQMHFPDATRWIETHFVTADAAMILAEFCRNIDMKAAVPNG